MVVTRPNFFSPDPLRKDGCKALRRSKYPVKDGTAVKSGNFAPKTDVMRAPQDHPVGVKRGQVVRKGQGGFKGQMLLNCPGERGRGIQRKAALWKAGDQLVQACTRDGVRRCKHEHISACRGGRADGGLHADNGKGKLIAHLLRADGGRRVARQHSGIHPQLFKDGQRPVHIAGDLLFWSCAVRGVGIVPIIVKQTAGQQTPARGEHIQPADPAVKHADAKQFLPAMI